MHVGGTLRTKRHTLRGNMMYVYTGRTVCRTATKTSWRYTARYIGEGIITFRNLYTPFAVAIHRAYSERGTHDEYG